MTTRAEIESRVEVMQAWLDGKAIQFRPAGEVGPFGWRNFDCDRVPKFNFVNSEYRIRPADPDTIDWSHVAPRFKFMARDYSGNTYLYECKPKMTLIEFYCNETDRLVLADDYASFRRGSVDWSESLVCRPEGV